MKTPAYTAGFAAATADINKYGIDHARAFAASTKDAMLDWFATGYGTRVNLSKERQAN